MNKIIKYIISLIIVFVAYIPNNANAAEKEMVIAQMNSCVNILTNIINNKSMTVLEHETDQLLNNLTMEQIVGLYEIAEFRGELIEAIGKLEITEEERNLLKRVNSIKQDNLKWQAFSNALNNTMLITGKGSIGVQAGFQALVTAARAGVEYKVAQNDLQIEELQAMWELRKSDLNTFIDLRKKALSIVFSLYQKYNLKETDRLTEQTAQQFQKITSDPNASRMVRLLLDNFQIFRHLADYYYYLGVGYIDMNNIPKAMEAFSKFETYYAKAPIYRINEKSGIISLIKLAYLDKLTTVEIEKELINVQKNLPSNTMALIQCAITYDKVLNNPQKALSLLRSALDDENTADKAALIIAGSMILPKVSNQSQERKDFLSAYANQKSIDVNAALNICIANKYNIFKFLDKKFSISDLCYRPWFFGSPTLNDKIVINYSKKYSLDLSKVKMFIEERKGNDIIVTQYKLTDPKSIPLEKIEKIDAFKKMPNLKYLYMWSTEDKLFRVKDNLDYNAILNENFPRQSEFKLSESDPEDIVEFLQKHESKSQRNEIIAEKVETKNKSIVEQGVKIWFPLEYQAYYLYNQNRLYNPIDDVDNWPIIRLYKHFKNQPDATYVKLFFDDSRKIIVCYKFDKENQKLIPCYTQYQGKIYFVNKSFCKEFGYEKTNTNSIKKNSNIKNQKDIKKEKSWWEKLWSSDEDEPKDTKDKKQQKDTKKEKSWWEKLWSSDEDKPKDTKVKNQQKDTKKEKSWWEKLWSSDEDESKDTKVKNQQKDTKKEKSWWEKLWSSDE